MRTSLFFLEFSSRRRIFLEQTTWLTVDRTIIKLGSGTCGNVANEMIDRALFLFPYSFRIYHRSFAKHRNPCWPHQAHSGTVLLQLDLIVVNGSELGRALAVVWILARKMAKKGLIYLLFTEDTARNEDSWSERFTSKDPSGFQFAGINCQLK